MSPIPDVSCSGVEWTADAVMDRLPIAVLGMGRLAGCSTVISSHTWQGNYPRPTRFATPNPRRLIQVLA
jgi:hypothetical protein